MKILFCIDTMSKGGAERVIANLANNLNGRNQVTILTLSKRKIEYKLNDGINISSIYEKEEKKNIFQKILFFVNTKSLYRKMIKKINPDIIISFLPYSSFFSIMAGKGLNIPVIVSVRNDPKEEYKSRINYILMKLLYKKATGFVFQTEQAKEFFSDYIQKKSEIISNPINPDFIGDRYDGPREKEIVAVGRLEEQKNHKMLLKAFSEVSQDFKDYKLVIYGEGSLSNELKELSKLLGIEDKVKFAGQVSNIKEKIYRASVFILSSNYEGMPNSLMEAMALGVPCIATDCPCGGCSFLINDGINGFLVPVDDEIGLAAKIKTLLGNKELQRSFSIQANKICEELSPEIINKKWEDFIRKMLVESSLKEKTVKFKKNIQK